MDIARPSSAGKRRRYVAGGLILGLLTIAGVMGVLRPAVPSVDRQGTLTDTVRRGPLVFQVRGVGTLQPIDVRMITAQVACKVERVLLFPGALVTESSIIAELSSAELQQSANDALWQMRRAEADYVIDRLNQQAALAAAHANAKEANALLFASERLVKYGLQSDIEVLRVKAKAEEANGHVASEEARMRLYETKEGQVGPAMAKLEQAKSLYALKRNQVESLQVRAGMTGILQQVPLQVGQQLLPGANLAKVAKPMPLKAELKVSESQAKDIQLGQPVSIDTRDGIVLGHVIRIDPAVMNGTVILDASMDGAMPKGVRPDLSVDGIVELDRAGNTLFVGRPPQAKSFTTMNLFRIVPGGSEAVRVKVKFGRASVSAIEILDGLTDGDQIILSDTSQFDAAVRIRIK